MPDSVGRMRPNKGFQADVFAAADIPSTCGRVLGGKAAAEPWC